MCEVGAGTGGLTRDAFPTLDVDNNCEILQYTATDISSVWAPRLLESINTTKLQFKARPCIPDRQVGHHAWCCTLASTSSKVIVLHLSMALLQREGITGHFCQAALH